MCLEILLSGTERTLLIQTSDSLPLLCHFLICLLLICLIRDAGDLETEFKLISDSFFLCPSKMARCMHWAGWEPTRPPRPQWGCMSRQKTSGCPSPPCLPQDMEPSPSCMVTRSMFWVSPQNCLINLNNLVVCQRHALGSLEIISYDHIIKRADRQENLTVKKKTALKNSLIFYSLRCLPL